MEDDSVEENWNKITKKANHRKFQPLMTYGIHVETRSTAAKMIGEEKLPKRRKKKNRKVLKNGTKDGKSNKVGEDSMTNILDRGVSNHQLIEETNRVNFRELYSTISEIENKGAEISEMEMNTDYECEEIDSEEGRNLPATNIEVIKKEEVPDAQIQQIFIKQSFLLNGNQIIDEGQLIIELTEEDDHDIINSYSNNTYPDHQIVEEISEVDGNIPVKITRKISRNEVPEKENKGPEVSNKTEKSSFEAAYKNENILDHITKIDGFKEHGYLPEIYTGNQVKGEKQDIKDEKSEITDYKPLNTSKLLYNNDIKTVCDGGIANPQILSTNQLKSDCCLKFKEQLTHRPEEEDQKFDLKVEKQTIHHDYIGHQNISENKLNKDSSNNNTNADIDIPKHQVSEEDKVNNSKIDPDIFIFLLVDEHANQQSTKNDISDDTDPIEIYQYNKKDINIENPFYNENQISLAELSSSDDGSEVFSTAKIIDIENLKGKEGVEEESNRDAQCYKKYSQSSSNASERVKDENNSKSAHNDNQREVAAQSLETALINIKRDANNDIDGSDNMETCFNHQEPMTPTTVLERVHIEHGERLDYNTNSKTSCDIGSNTSLSMHRAVPEVQDMKISFMPHEECAADVTFLLSKTEFEVYEGNRSEMEKENTFINNIEKNEGIATSSQGPKQKEVVNYIDKIKDGNNNKSEIESAILSINKVSMTQKKTNHRMSVTNRAIHKCKENDDNPQKKFFFETTEENNNKTANEDALNERKSRLRKFIQALENLLEMEKETYEGITDHEIAQLLQKIIVSLIRNQCEDKAVANDVKSDKAAIYNQANNTEEMQENPQSEYQTGEKEWHETSDFLTSTPHKNSNYSRNTSEANQFREENNISLTEDEEKYSKTQNDRPLSSQVVVGCDSATKINEIFLIDENHEDLSSPGNKVSEISKENGNELDEISNEFSHYEFMKKLVNDIKAAIIFNDTCDSANTISGSLIEEFLDELEDRNGLKPRQASHDCSDDDESSIEESEGDEKYDEEIKNTSDGEELSKVMSKLRMISVEGKGRKEEHNKVPPKYVRAEFQNKKRKRKTCGDRENDEDFEESKSSDNVLSTAGSEPIKRPKILNTTSVDIYSDDDYNDATVQKKRQKQYKIMMKTYLKHLRKQKKINLEDQSRSYTDAKRNNDDDYDSH